MEYIPPWKIIEVTLFIFFLNIKIWLRTLTIFLFDSGTSIIGNKKEILNNIHES
jgi:hypothetical protein